MIAGDFCRKRKERIVAIRFRRELGLDRRLAVCSRWCRLFWKTFIIRSVISTLSGTARVGPDPRMWGWFIWVIMLGPLLGYGFLAGATIRIA